MAYLDNVSVYGLYTKLTKLAFLKKKSQNIQSVETEYCQAQLCMNLQAKPQRISCIFGSNHIQKAIP